MTASEKYALLKSARQQLSGYRTLQCGQHHEKVVDITRVETGGNADYPDWRIQLQGLCNRQIRDSTLGCAHTAVLTRYNSILNQLVVYEIFDPAAVPLQEINELIAAIYLMDHEKGMLEKRRAVLKQTVSVGNEREVALRLGALRQEHTDLVRRLEELHQQVLKTLGRAIAEYEA